MTWANLEKLLVPITVVVVGWLTIADYCNVAVDDVAPIVSDVAPIRSGE